MTLRGILAGCTAACALIYSASFAQAQTLGPLTVVPGARVFDKCTADQVASQPGTNFDPSAIEPWIAVDPTTAGHLLIGVQQDRWSNGGARGLRGGVSVDSGKTWTNTVPHGVSLCSGGRFQRSTDPWTGFGLDGTAYFFSLAFNNNPSTLVNGESAMLASRSTDGGVTWSQPIALIDDTDPLAFNDKNSLTTDPNRPSYVYAVWDRLYGPPSAFKAPGGSDEHPNAQAQSAVQAHDGLAMARNRIATLRQAAATGASLANETFGPSYYARSTDSGQTWERAVPIYDPGRNAQTIANLIVGLPQGDLLDFFDHITSQGQLSIGYVRSVDHGFSWTRSAFTVAPIGGQGAVTPDGKKPLRDASILFSPSVDAAGNLYVAWEDTPAGSSIVGVLFTQSTDGGKTWSAPVKVNATPANSTNPLRGQGFNPTIVAAQGGNLVLTYYDFRNDVAGAAQELADAWVLFCNNSADATACTNPANWGHELRLTNKSFNIVDAPLTDSGYFLGDYFGLTTTGRNVWPAFTLVTGVGQTTLFTRTITLPAATRLSSAVALPVVK